jgi:hypothetical protein
MKFSGEYWLRKNGGFDPKKVEIQNLMVLGVLYY